MNLRALLWAVVLVPLSGCAGPGRVTPADFPLHASDHRFFDLHWRLVRTDRTVRAQGLVEATRVDGIAEVILELQGLDRDGRVLSRGLGRTYGGRLLRWGTQPFAVTLRPQGREDRFELAVWSYSWEGTRDRGARSGGH